MIKAFLDLFKPKPKKLKWGFSEFFRYASKEEKKRVLMEVLREANQDQREALERYKKINAKKALELNKEHPAG